MQLVSIIIPCHNYGWILAETLDSILMQSYANWECIIVDDGSIDNTKDVVDKYCIQDKRFVYVSQNNMGVSAARNNGLSRAKGEYIQFLDADDLLAFRKIEKQVDYLVSNQDIGVIYGDVRYFEHGEKEILSRSYDMCDISWKKDEDGFNVGIKEVLVEKNTIVINAPLVRVQVIDLVGQFDEELPAMEDWEFWLRCALAGIKFSYDSSPDMWSFVRIHGTSASQYRPRMVYFELQIRRKMQVDFLLKNENKLIEINALAIKRQTEGLAIFYVSAGNVLKGFKSFLELAHASKQYKYYLKSFAYWLRKRFSIYSLF